MRLLAPNNGFQKKWRKTEIPACETQRGALAPIADLAAQLPREVAFYLQTLEHRRRMSLDEFFELVSLREEIDLPVAVYHARVVLEVLQEAVSPGEIQDVLAEFPPDWAPLFQRSQGDCAFPQVLVSPVGLRQRQAGTDAGAFIVQPNKRRERRVRLGIPEGINQGAGRVFY